MGYDPRPTEERFWSKIVKSECWNWTGCINAEGYGVIWCGQTKRQWRTHRLSLKLAGIKLIDGLFVDHACKNRRCANPDHLRQVTPGQNLLENSLSYQAKHASQTHCVKGHEFTPENTRMKRQYQHGGMERICRECGRIECRNRRSRQRSRFISPEGKEYRG